MGESADLLAVDEARRRILEAFPPLPAQSLRLQDALGLFLAESVYAPRPLPPFANSAMDGFAVRAEDTVGTPASESIALRVSHEIPAGAQHPGMITSGEAARIMTGAPLPEGADTVVPFEDTHSGGDTVRVPGDRNAGACVRPVALDVEAGQQVLEAGTRLGSRQLALCAALGLGEVSVHRRPVVAVLTTGDELVEPGGSLEGGQIYNSNGIGLAAAAREAGAEVLNLGNARDDFEDLREKMAAAQTADLLLTSGGVSVGDFDHVKQVIGASGSTDFWRVRVRPGKPLVFGTIARSGVDAAKSHSTEVRLLGLPGNPTSTMVTFFVFARPAIRKMLGDPMPVTRPMVAEMDDRLDNGGGRETFFRVVAYESESGLRARLSGAQDSSMVLPLARANALARVPADVASISPGQRVEIYRLEDPLGW